MGVRQRPAPPEISELDIGPTFSSGNRAVKAELQLLG